MAIPSVIVLVVSAIWAAHGLTPRPISLSTTEKYRVTFGQGQPAETSPIVALRAAARNGDASAQYDLAVNYSNGTGVPRDLAQAAQWLRQAAAQGFAPAQGDLGVLYSTGNGVAKDDAAALEWYRKAAEQNDAGAQNNLGAVYGNGIGIAADQVEAYKWFKLAAAQNHPLAVRSLQIITPKLSSAQLAEGDQRAAQFLSQKSASAK